MEYIVLFSHVKAVYYTKTKVCVLNHVPLAKLDISRPWAQHYHFVPCIIDHGHKANQAACRLSRTHGTAGQLTWLVLSRNSYWINQFKLSTFYSKILKGAQQCRLNKLLQSREQYDYFRGKYFTGNKGWGGKKSFPSFCRNGNKGKFQLLTKLDIKVDEQMS